jgi:hypothetical protein
MRTLYEIVKGCKSKDEMHKHNVVCFDELISMYGEKDGMSVVQFINRCYNADSEFAMFGKDWSSFLNFHAKECGIKKDNLLDVVVIGSRELLDSIEWYIRMQNDEEYGQLVAKKTLQAKMQSVMIAGTADVNDLKVANEITNKTLDDIKLLEESIRNRKQSIGGGNANQHISVARGALNIASIVKNEIPN